MRNRSSRRSTSNSAARWNASTSPKIPTTRRDRTGVLVADGSVWVGRRDSCELLRLDPQTGELEHRFEDICLSFAGLAYGDGSVWAAGFEGMSRIDPKTNTVTKASGFEGGAYAAAGGGFGWTSDETKGVVYKVDQTGNLVATYHTGEGARTVSYSDGACGWATRMSGRSSVSTPSPGTGRSYSFEHPLQAVAAGSGVVLVQLNQGRTYEDRIEALQGSVGKFFVRAYQLEQPDPALVETPLAFQVEYATCANLLRYGDEEGIHGRAARAGGRGGSADAL